jgi:aminoglycoside/choline kinase family phosphotransferase
MAQGVEISDDAQAFARQFDLVGLQRHLRVMGVFARLCLRDQKPDYLNDLPLVLDYVREALARYHAEPAVGAFSDWFEEAVMPKVASQHWYSGQRTDEC